jgi:hypothetical protein
LLTPRKRIRTRRKAKVKVVMATWNLKWWQTKERTRLEVCTSDSFVSLCKSITTTQPKSSRSWVWSARLFTLFAIFSTSQTQPIKVTSSCLRDILWLWCMLSWPSNRLWMIMILYLIAIILCSSQVKEVWISSRRLPLLG